MTGRMLGSARRVCLVAALVIALVGGSTSAAWALWSSSAATGSSTTLGKLAASLTGTSAMTTTFSSSSPSETVPLTLANTGSLAGTYSTSVAVTQGASLAAAVTVVAWPVAGASACTASSAVGSSSVSGTWASAPSLTGSLAPSTSAIWCVRSSPTSSAPPSSTATISISLVVSTGSWQSSASVGGFYLNTGATATATPAIQCTNPDAGNFHAKIAFDASARSSDTYYGLEVAGTRVEAPAQGYTGYIDLAGSDISTSTADGSTQVDVVVLDSNQNPTTTVAATGRVTLATANGSRTVTCGG